MDKYLNKLQKNMFRPFKDLASKTKRGDFASFWIGKRRAGNFGINRPGFQDYQGKSAAD